MVWRVVPGKVNRVAVAKGQNGNVTSPALSRLEQVTAEIGLVLGDWLGPSSWSRSDEMFSDG